MLRAVFQSNLLNNVVYIGVLSGWSLEDPKKLDSIIVFEYLRRTKIHSTDQTENIIQPTESGGLEFKRLSPLIQDRKQAIVDRLQDSPAGVRRAVERMLRWSQLLCHPNQTGGVQGIGLWASSSILSFTVKGRVMARPTKNREGVRRVPS